MTENCKNCNEIIEKNFCNNCGQKKYKRIDRKYVLDEIQYTFLHANKGLLFSVKNILKNPGKIAKDFIDGNRVNHYKPILLTFVISGISTFITYKVLGLKEIMSAYYSDKHLNSKFMTDFMTVMSSYNSILMVLLVPFFALTTKIAYRKWGHNYYEHIVMNAYILTFYQLLCIIFMYPIMYLLRHESPGTLFSISQYSMLLVPFVLTWFFKEFYDSKPWKKIITKTFAVIGLTILGYILLIVLFVIGVAIYAMLKGPEALKYIQPK